MPCSYTRLSQPCESETIPGSNYCLHHSTLECVSCHQQATHNCEHVRNQTCGAPLCDECVHVELPNGGNGQLYQHTRPGAELDVPHYGKAAMEAKK